MKVASDKIKTIVDDNLSLFKRVKMSQKVNYSWKLNQTYRKINTSEFCFLCLKTTKIKTETPYELNGFSNNNESKKDKGNPPISLLCLRRHLRINDNEISGSGEPSSVPNDDFKVNLCKVCQKIVCKFSVLFQQLEKIEMEMDYYLGKIRLCIKEGMENLELVDAYSKGMTNKADTLSQLAWIDKLRKQIYKKCSTVRVASHPSVDIDKVGIEKDSIRPIAKEEDNNEIEEAGNNEEPSPPVSPQTSPTDSCSISNMTENAISPTQMEIEMDKNAKRFHCPSCNQSFTQKHVAQTHFNVIHLQEKWKCEHCTIEIRAYPVAIRTHKSKCRESLQKSSEDGKARKHFRFPCAICSKRFPNPSRLAKHKRIVHEASRPFPCTVCGKGFKHASDLKLHNSSVHLGVKWKCKFCSKGFSQPGRRAMHEKTCLKKSDVKVEREVPTKLKISRDLLTGRVPCPSCEKTFAETCQARRHHNEIHLKKRSKCDLCLATFAESCLNRHRKTCLDKIRRQSRLLFSCPTCGKKIPTRKSLVRHQRRHFSKSEFPCDLCEKRYKERRHLKYHKDTAHFNKTISCEYCKKRLKPRSFFDHKRRCEKKNSAIKLESNAQEAEDSVATSQLNHE